MRALSLLFRRLILSYLSLLLRLAVDVLTIPDPNCECERMFSELGDLLEPRRRKISSEFVGTDDWE